ncbi:MAG: PIN domain-containing protein [Pyrinomonadaceae bacterium]
MGSLIDTNILVEAERRRLNLADHAANREGDFFLSVITVSEMLHGLHRSTKPGVSNRRAAFIEEIFERFPILAIDFGVAKIHSRIWADLAIKGQIIGMNDLWIAATCISYGLTIITANVREFERIPGLDIEIWQTN